MRLPDELDWSAVRGQTEPPLGWYSPCFGARIPIVTLIGQGLVAGGTRLITDLRIELEAPSTRCVERDRAMLADH
jgi:hypothetical protein